MATSFNGWGSSWGNSWGPITVDPNAMYGSASFSFNASLQVNEGEMQGAASFVITAIGELSHGSTSKSGVSRLWLIEYYTKAFAKTEPLKTVGVNKATQRKRQAAQEAKIAEQVEKAEHDLEVLTRGLKDVQAAQRFTQALLLQARALPEPEFDFMAVAQEYHTRMRRADDDELLLLSMIV